MDPLYACRTEERKRFPWDSLSSCCTRDAADVERDLRVGESDSTIHECVASHFSSASRPPSALQSHSLQGDTLSDGPAQEEDRCSTPSRRREDTPLPAEDASHWEMHPVRQ